MSNELTVTQARKLVDKIKLKAGELAEAIRKLRDSEGWAVLGYKSWAECCEAEFGYTKQHANRLIKAEQIKLEVEPMGSTQPNERQARELARLPKDQQADCWQDVLDAAEQTGEKPTARAVQEKVDLWLADDEPIAVDVPVEADVDQGDGVDAQADETSLTREQLMTIGAMFADVASALMHYLPQVGEAADNDRLAVRLVRWRDEFEELSTVVNSLIEE